MKEKSKFSFSNLITLLSVITITINIYHNGNKYLLIIPMYADFIYMDSYNVVIENNTNSHYSILSIPMEENGTRITKSFYNNGETIFSYFSVLPNSNKLIFYDKGFPQKYLISTKNNVFEFDYFKLPNKIKVNLLQNKKFRKIKNVSSSIKVINNEFVKFVLSTVLLLIIFILLFFRREVLKKINYMARLIRILTIMVVLILLIFNTIYLILEIKYIYLINFVIK